MSIVILEMIKLYKDKNLFYLTIAKKTNYIYTIDINQKGAAVGKVMSF